METRFTRREEPAGRARWEAQVRRRCGPVRLSRCGSPGAALPVRLSHADGRGKKAWMALFAFG